MNELAIKIHKAEMFAPKATSQIEATDPGVVKGKFSYLSPEAANGRDVDQRSDIFAAGIVLSMRR